MDFINQAYAQLTDLFKSMTPGARMTAGLLLVVIVVSLGYLFKQQSTGADALLLGGQAFNTAELQAMQGAFGKAGLSGFSVNGAQVSIPRGQQAVYLAALADSGAMPANFGDYMTLAVNNANPFVSRFQQEESLKIAKQKELALIIRSMPGIATASVMFDAQRKPGLNRQDRLTTASVMIKPIGNQPLEEQRILMIRQLVAGAFAGLPAESVTITDANGAVYSAAAPGTPGSLGGLDNAYLSLMKKYQAEYESKAMRALSYVPGIQVSANVVLDTEMSHIEENVKVDPKTVPLTMSEQTSSESMESPAPGGRPGLESQGANAAARLATTSGGPKTQIETTTSDQTNAVTHGRITSTKAGLTPQKVTLSVSVPSNYFEKVWREQNPAAEGQPVVAPDKAALDAIQQVEMAKIKNHVAGLIPTIDPTVDPLTLITVNTFQHVTESELLEPAMAEQALAWLGNYWSTLGVLGMAGFSLLMLRSMVRSGPTVSATSFGPLPLPTSEPERQETPAEETPKSRFRRRLGTGPSMRDELATMVREDPDAAANILKGWIGNAG